MIEPHSSSNSSSASKDPRIFIKRRMPKTTPIVLTALLGLVIVLGTLGVILVQRQLKLAQDYRNNASVAGGIVDVVASKVNDPVLNQPMQIKFDVNTHNAQIDGVQLIFTLSGPTMSMPQLAFPNSQLQTLVQNVEQLSGSSYKVTVLVVPQSVGQAFSSNSNSTFMTLTTTPSAYGNFTLSYDNSQSLTTIYNSDPPQDQLKTLTNNVITFSAPQSPSPVASPSPTPMASPSPTPQVTPSPTPTVVPSPSPSPSPTQRPPSPSPSPSPTQRPPSPTPTPQVTPSPTQKDDLLMEANNQFINFYTTGGDQVSSNNLLIGTTYKVRVQYTIQNIMKSAAGDSTQITQRLTVNGSPLATSYITYGLVRQHQDGGSGAALEGNFTAQATNTITLDADVNDTIDESNESNNFYSLTYTASQPGTGGTTTVGCNESCTSSAQCGNNLFCYNNQCRLAANPDSSSCSQPADNGIARSCNEYCADSRECGSGYTCYYNQCRRPDNISSNSCAAPVTYTYVPNWNNTSTGGYVTPSTPTYVADGNITPMQYASPTPGSDIGTEYFEPQPIDSFASPTPFAPVASPTVVDAETQQGGIGQWLMEHIWMLIGGLLAIIALIVAIILMGRRGEDQPPQTGMGSGFSNGRPVSPMSGGSTPPTKPTGFSSSRTMDAASKDEYEQQLQKRISELQLPKPPVSAAKPASAAPAAGFGAAAGSMSANNQPPAAPVFTPRPTTPITPAAASSSAPAMSMGMSSQDQSFADNLPNIKVPGSAPVGGQSPTGFGAAAPSATADAGNPSTSMMDRLKSRSSYNSYVNSATN